ncbi:hypothetical protein Zm00014a_012098 [Zea mays]|uniref:Uncharacterized protein n=1 Tax=Zea mays TaxID=4577 RepID=A0A3L6FPR8_MAIZE|nr:hypothetical protein Zm00014a_012098 [Zea mays]
MFKRRLNVKTLIKD